MRGAFTPPRHHPLRAVFAFTQSVALSSQVLERAVRQSVHRPLVLRAGAEGLVEADGRGVPVQDGPFEALVAALHADAGQFGEEGLAVAGASDGGADVEVLQVDAVDAAPGGEVQEPEGEAD